MRIREYTPNDLDALRRMHSAQGFGYPLPDLDSPLFLSKLVLEDENAEAESGREVADANSPPVTMAILQRLTAETYLLHDPSSGTPRQRWERFVALHDAARRDAAAHGLDDVQAFLPPQIARPVAMFFAARAVARIQPAVDPVYFCPEMRARFARQESSMAKTANRDL